MHSNVLKRRSASESHGMGAANVLGETFGDRSFDVQQYTLHQFELHREDEMHSICEELTHQNSLVAQALQHTVQENFTKFVGISQEIETMEHEVIQLKSLLNDSMTSLQYVRDVAMPLLSSSEPPIHQNIAKYHNKSKFSANETTRSNDHEEIMYELELRMVERDFDHVMAELEARGPCSQRDAFISILCSDLQSPTLHLTQLKQTIHYLSRLGEKDYALHVFLNTQTRLLRANWDIHASYLLQMKQIFTSIFRMLLIYAHGFTTLENLPLVLNCETHLTLPLDAKVVTWVSEQILQLIHHVLHQDMKHDTLLSHILQYNTMMSNTFGISLTYELTKAIKEGIHT